MNFFNRHSATTTESPTSVPSPQTQASSPSPVSPMGTTATPSTDRPETPPPSGEHPKKFRFPRFRKPLSTKSNPPSDKSPDTSTATHVPILTPQKITRRVARRLERQRLHDEWVEKNHQLRKEAVAQNRPFEPLPEPPHINSDSEHDDHEDEEPEAVIMPSPTEKPQSTEIGYLEQRSQNESGENGIEGGTLLPARSDGAQVAASQGADEMPVLAGPPRNLMAEAKMADMLGREAYTGLREDVGSGNGTMKIYAGANGEEENGQITGQGEAVGRRVLRGPTHVGWGDAYGSVPSQPMYGNPVVSYANPALDIDYVLSEKIRRGRELGRLAVSQEEQGNLGAAESGYMKALELLIPATRELEVGSDLTNNARMGVKRKVQREAASMLDRVEEIKVFLKANGPAVPNVLPAIPAMVPPHPKGRGSQYGGQSDSGESPGEGRARRRVKRELDKQKENSASPELGAQSMVQSKKKSSIGKASNKPPPPPPPPFFGDNESGDFLQRITNRKNVVSDASAGFHSVGVSRIISKPSSKSTRTGKANCFMCNAPATLVAPCDHAFCSSCGRQACSVFENCPVPGCNKPLSMETFSEIQ